MPSHTKSERKKNKPRVVISIGFSGKNKKNNSKKMSKGRKR